jgi:hypothetical protein
MKPAWKKKANLSLTKTSKNSVVLLEAYFISCSSGQSQIPFKEPLQHHTNLVIWRNYDGKRIHYEISSVPNSRSYYQIDSIVKKFVIRMMLFVTKRLLQITNYSSIETVIQSIFQSRTIVLASSFVTTIENAFPFMNSFLHNYFSWKFYSRPLLEYLIPDFSSPS